MRLRYNHIGMATKDITETISAMKKTGTCNLISDETFDPLQKVKLQLVEWNGITIELITGIGENNPVENFLKKGTPLYHLCFSCNDIDESVNKMTQNGWILFSESKPAMLFEDSPVAFLYNPSIGIIELLQE